MRGPHNIIRLIRTGATLERTGAMNVVLDAFEAPRAVRFVAHALGKPLQWLGYKGDPEMPLPHAP
jgi:ubiquinone biosynthesis protein